MNGVHDMGGMQDFGPVAPEPDEPVFHADWERRAFALTLAVSAPGGWNLDMSRHARESLPPALYLSSSYYQIWLAGIERLLGEAGLVTADEIEAGRPSGPARPVARILRAEDVPATMAKGGPVDRPPQAAALFSPGDAVRARNINPQGHTRLPRYVRGHPGTIARVHGCHIFPDAHAHGLGERPQWVYSVRFSARDLWGEDAAPGDSVHVDLWEPYLDPA
ncbi:nitrile hydratase subunit beta [Microbaculum marinum]|uniref:Nitrile hydratase subunit beta n=1 Tax=Microbaculum marinum TaxID=1764581 RepID=A0AAW9RJN5_9HYPH